ncbi:helix-turn-helix transcriptional regulator [Zhihengliuella flava]|uniref:DNA-binding CsgD family transcriptional regulator/tetratricopeptide (TPR) repeat protein n=1 Tax=Zhihengliuella flava TaxID=1285193 RepID=A0A931GFN6_9MICC|nr:DNA-binding CsgD family transcriptional regulator/tetratricopeptide (TPR) repeat protein [Zhihengliuella flava]
MPAHPRLPDEPAHSRPAGSASGLSPAAQRRRSSSPVWARVSACVQDARLLAVRAPAGTGRHRLIAAWGRSHAAQERDYRVVEAHEVRAALPSGQAYDAGAAVTAALAAAREQAPLAALAVILPPQPAAADAARAAGAVVVEAGDLLLNRAEAAAYCGGESAWFEAAWAQFGGWLHAWDTLLDANDRTPDQQEHGGVNVSAVADELHPAVTDAWLTWIQAQPAALELARIGQFPVLTRAALAHVSSGSLALGLDPAQRVGLAQREADGPREGATASSWSVPTSLRRVCAAHLYSVDPGRAREAVRETARALNASGRIADAVRLARTAGEWETLTPILLGGWANLLDGNRDLIVGSFQAIPPEATRLHPALRAGQVLLDPSEINTAMPVSNVPDQSAILEDLRHQHARTGRRQGAEALTTAIALMVYERRLGLYETAGMRAAEVLQLSAAAPPEVESALHSVAGFEVGLSSLMAGQVQQAFAGYELAHRRAAAGDYTTGALISCAGLALLHVYRGELAAAQASVGEGRQHLARYGPHSRGAETLTIVSALIALEQFDEPTAEAELATLPAFPANSDRWPFHLLALVRLALLQQRYGDADRMLERAEADRSFAAHSPVAARLMNILRVESQLSRGDVRAALSEAEQRLGDSLDGLIYRAWCLIFAGRRVEARELAAQALSLDPPVRERLLADALRTTTLPAPEGVDEFVQRYGHRPRPLIGLVPLWQSEAHRAAARARGVFDAEELRRLDGIGARRFASTEEMPRLTPRERELLTGLSRGLTRKQIAEELFVSPNTIKSQASSLYGKLGASSRAEALAAAERWNLI